MYIRKLRLYYIHQVTDIHKLLTDQILNLSRTTWLNKKIMEFHMTQPKRQIIEMNILSKGKEQPITSEMIAAVLKKLAKGNAEPLPMTA